LKGSNQVVSTGGGAVLRETNREAMLNRGFVVGLSAEPKEIIHRVKQDGDQRPLLQGNAEEKVRALLEARADAYGFAHLTIDTTKLSIEQIVIQIMNKL
jgi:shikimate kinase